MRRYLLHVLGRMHRAWILLAVIAFIELDVRKIVTLQLPQGHETSTLHPVLEVVREHFTAHFLLLPFYILIIFFPILSVFGRLINRSPLWVLPIGLLLGFSYFITIEANIGVLLHWYRPGFQEVAFSMSLLPFALLVFLTQDARRIIRSLRDRH